MSDLPPLDQPQAYVVVGPNDQRGPYALDLLIGEVVAGRLHDATPVWWPGLAEWTTMSGNAGVAGEIARRRGGYAEPAPAPTPAPTPEPTAQYDQASYQPQPQQTYEAGQYETAQYDTAAYGTAEAVQSAAGQDYSYDPSAGVEVAAQPAPQAEPAYPVAAEPAAAEAPAEVVSEVPDGTAAVPAGWTVTDTAAPVAEPAPEPEIVEAEVVAAEEVPAATSTSTVTDEHRALFAGLVDRSTRRAEAGDRIAALDTSFADAVVAGAESQGFSTTDRTTGDTNHELRFEGAAGAGESLSITLGRIKGDDLGAVRDGHVPLSVRFQSAVYAGGLEAGVGAHGEVVVVSDEWSGQATSAVALLLTLSDYLSPELEVDNLAVLRDVGATVSVVSDRLR